MTTARLISDPAAVQALVWPCLRRRHKNLRGLQRLKLHPLGSVAAGRGVAQIEVQAIAAKKQVIRFELFANYDTRGGSKTIAGFLALLERHGFGRGTYGAPRLLCFSAKHKLLVYESFPGRRVRDELEAGRLTVAGLNAVMRQSAIWLKKFHRLPPRIGRVKNMRLAPSFFSALTEDHRRVIAAALPHINKELARRVRHSLVHGDPHLANCIRDTNRSFAFIDYSEGHLGSAAEDMAMYLVHLDVALQPFFSRRTIGRAQKIFLQTYYGRPVNQLALRTKRSLLAYELRTAALFLRFTSDHHRHPTKQVAWMIQHFVNVLSRGTDELRGADPQLILAA